MNLPARNHEHWKYADLAFLADRQFAPVKHLYAISELREMLLQHRLQRGESILLAMVNGRFISELSDTDKLPEKVVACNIQEALHLHADVCATHWPKQIDAEKYPFASLNTTLHGDGLFLYVPANIHITQPIHVLSLLIDTEECMVSPQQLIVIGAESKVEIMEEYYTQAKQAYLVNLTSTFVLAEKAQLTLTKLQQEGLEAIHLAHTLIEQQQDSEMTLLNFASGGVFARDDVIVKLLGAGSSCDTAGFYHVNGNKQTVDNHLDIDHCASCSKSNMLYKGIIDQKARAIFNGRVHVAKNAQKIQAHQANHHLLLSNEAEAYAKPELEIYADDVQCKHGATTGQIDPDAIFYLRARGIPEAEALALLLQGFAAEIIEKVTHPGMKLRVQEVMLCR